MYNQAAHQRPVEKAGSANSEPYPSAWHLVPAQYQRWDRTKFRSEDNSDYSFWKWPNNDQIHPGNKMFSLSEVKSRLLAPYWAILGLGWLVTPGSKPLSISDLHQAIRAQVRPLGNQYPQPSVRKVETIRRVEQCRFQSNLWNAIGRRLNLGVLIDADPHVSDLQLHNAILLNLSWTEPSDE